MSDFTFNIKVSQGPIAEALWESVYRKITHPQFHSDRRAAYYEVQRLWRARTLQLRDIQTPGFEGVNLQYSRNCPPVGCRTGRTSRICNRNRICPFCWGRNYVVPLFKRLDKLLFRFPESTQSEPLRIHWLSVDRKLFDNWDDARREVQVGSKSLVKGYGFNGGVTFCHTYMTEKQNRIRVMSCSVLTMPAGKEIRGKHSFLSKPVITRAELPKLVSQTCGYPPGLLDPNRDPVQVKTLLHEMKGVRPTTCFGVLRGLTKKQETSSE